LLDALRWRLPWTGAVKPEEQAGTAARFGGEGGDGPVLIAMIHGPVEIEMAKDVLAEANIPALVKQNSLGRVYGLSVGSFAAAEVWVPLPLAEQARDLLIGIGLVDEESDPLSDES
jgi:hypothetical protein